MHHRSSVHRQRSGQTNPTTLLKIAGVGLAMTVTWWLAMSEPTSSPEAAASPSSNAPPPLEAAMPAAPPATPEPTPQSAPAMRVDLADKPTTAAAATPSQVGVNQAAAPDQPSALAPKTQGPVAELSQRFAGESRGPDSEQDEARIRAAFVDPTIPPTLLRSVECRRSVCRTELRWSEEHRAGYVLGLTRAVGDFAVPVGIEGAGPIDTDGLRPVVVYIRLARPIPSAR